MLAGHRASWPVASGSWSQLSTPTLDKTRPLLAGTMESISARGRKSSAACEMTRKQRLIRRLLLGSNPKKCRNLPCKSTEKCRNTHFRTSKKCRNEHLITMEKCILVLKQHVIRGALMLQRKAKAQFESWLASSPNKALLVKGARQVGKSYLVNVFANESFENVVTFDLSPTRPCAIRFWRRKVRTTCSCACLSLQRSRWLRTRPSWLSTRCSDAPTW